MKGSLNILQANSGYGWNGGPYQILLLSRGLMKRGHRVVVVCSPESEMEREATAAGIPVETVPMHSQWDLLAARVVLGIIQKYNIDLVNAHKPEPHTLCLMAAHWARRFTAAYRRRAPAFVTTRRVSFSLRRYPLWRIKWVWGVDQIIAVSEDVKEVLIRSGVPSKKITRIYGAVDIDRFRPSPPNGEIHRELGIEDKCPVIGMVADFRPWKGHRVFLEAASIVMAKEPGVRFLVVGQKAGEFQAVMAYAHHLKLEGKVIFTDFRNDVERLYPMMTALMNCSTGGEGIPGVLREAMAMEIPVVATNVGGNPEVVIHGETGFLVPPRDPEALARAILGLLQDPEQRRRIGRNGRKWVEERFSIDAMVTQTEALYQEALNVIR